MRRKRIARRKSRKMFKRTALKTHKRNIVAPARGGIRL